MDKSQQSYYVMPFYKKIWYNIKNYILDKIHNFKFPYATVIFFLLLVGVFGTIVLVIKNNKIDIVPRPEYVLDDKFYSLSELVKKDSDYEFKTITLENSNYKFELEEENTTFELTDLKTGNIYKSNPFSDKKEVFKLYYAANRGIEKSFDSYTKSTKGYNVSIKVIDTKDEKSIELYYLVGNTGVVKEDFPVKITEELYKQMEEAIKNYKGDYKKLNLRAGLKLYTQDVKHEGEEKVYKRQDSALNGWEHLYKLFYDVCGFTVEKVQEQNELFGITEVKETAVFNVGLKYILHEDRLETKVINAAFTEEKYPIIGIDLLPYFNAGDDSDEGYIMIPDGSGILINFNNNKPTAKEYNKRIYGSDNGINEYYMTEETENITMPLYGIKNGSKTMLSVIKQGAEMTNIVAKSANQQYKENTCAYKFYLREGLKYKFNGWNSEQEVTGWTKSYITDDFVVDYYFLDTNAGYVEMAQKTKEIFFGEKQNIQNTLKLDLNVLGAYKKDESVLGFPVTRVDTLTNLSQIDTIINELNGINNININFEGMFNDGLTNYSLEKLKLNKAMGNKSDLLKVLEKYTGNRQLYVSLNLGTLYTDEDFDEKKYAVRDPFSDIVEHYKFDEPTQVPLQGQEPLYTIKGSFIDDYNKEVMGQLKKYNVKSINVLDLGNTISGSYRNKDTEFRDAALKQYLETLQLYKDNGFKLNAYAPSLYMINYLDSVNGIPSSGTLYNATDLVIPFYQLVLSGKVEYSTRSINLEDQYSLDYHILKAIETGSNLNFTVSHDNTSELMKTYFNNYYNTHYVNQLENIKKAYNELNSIGYANGYLVNHESLANDVVKVTYSNGISIILNYSNKAYDGIEPLAYKVV